MQRSSDAGGMLEHIAEFEACCNYVLEMAEMVGPIPNLYMEDPANANNMIPAPAYMHREHEIRDNDKKTWFLAGVTREEYKPLKASMIIDHAISYVDMVAKFTLTHQALQSADRTVVMSSNSHNVPTTRAFIAEAPSILGKRNHGVFDQFEAPRQPFAQGAPPTYSYPYGAPPAQAMISPATPQFSTYSGFVGPICFNCGDPGHPVNVCPSLTCGHCNKTYASDMAPGRHTCVSCAGWVPPSRPRFNRGPGGGSYQGNYRGSDGRNFGGGFPQGSYRPGYGQSFNGGFNNGGGGGNGSFGGGGNGYNGGGGGGYNGGGGGGRGYGGDGYNGGGGGGYQNGGGRDGYSNGGSSRGGGVNFQDNSGRRPPSPSNVNQGPPQRARSASPGRSSGAPQQSQPPRSPGREGRTQANTASNSRGSNDYQQFNQFYGYPPAGGSGYESGGGF
jgi:hypothetical protein